MRYSFSEISPYSRQTHTQSIKPFDVKNTVETSEKKGVPNYTTIIPSAAEAGNMRKPMSNPNLTTPPRTAPSNNGSSNGQTMTPTTPGEQRTMPGMNGTMPGTTPGQQRTMPGTTSPETPTTPTQPRTFPGTNGTIPGTNGTMPGMNGTMPGMNGTMPGGATTPGTPTTPSNGMTRPGTLPSSPERPGTTPSRPRTGMPAQPSPQNPSSPRIMPPPSAQECYYNNNRNGLRSGYMNDYDDYDDMYDDYDGMMMPGMFMNPNVPMGIPIMPLYGYDNSDDADKDWDYMRQMYPSIAKKLLREIDEECDKLEYDGSCIFDEYPDRVYLERIVDRIFERVKHLEEDEDFVMPESLDQSSKSENNTVEASQYSQFYRDDRRDRRDRRRRNFSLRDLLEVLLFNEILNRRRRYRSRRRWF